DTITVNWPATGINTLNGNTISIYPNPAKELVNIESTATIKSIEMMNYIGQSVFNKFVDNKKTQVNVSTLAPGVYFVKITTDQGTRTTKITVEK
ncbi:MAG: T9SS type A sorting domain-containing protein, partial [Bacteroidota bacterium]